MSDKKSLFEYTLQMAQAIHQAIQAQDFPTFNDLLAIQEQNMALIQKYLQDNPVITTTEQNYLTDILFYNQQTEELANEHVQSLKSEVHAMKKRRKLQDYLF